MKGSYQNYRQQKQSSKVMRSYIVQAAAKGATEEELDILCQAYLLEQKYGLAVNSTTERRPPVRRIYDIAVFATRVDAEKVYSHMPNEPYVISPDDYGENDNYTQISLVYYAGDGVLADDEDEVVEDIEDTVGEDFAEHFGEYEDDSVFIRNDRLRCDYEILRDNRSFSDVAEGSNY